MTPFATLRPGQVQHLPETPQLAESWHQWSQAEIDALSLAWAAKRPLLVRGEPGTGKTQLARAVSVHLGWAFHSETIHPRFEPQDLMYRFDAVKRLADAQANKDLRANETSYWRPGVLWKAFDWASASAYMAAATAAESPQGHVVLIDEIDKADSDLPNSLLEVLAQRWFEIEPLGIKVGGTNLQRPLILITTNDERDLPAAFQRRCIVLSIEADDATEDSYAAWLVERGKAHFGAQPEASPPRAERIQRLVLEDAAMQLCRDRRAIKKAGLSPPGLAEYLDLLYAIHEMAERDQERQLGLIRQLSAYAYLKHGHVEGHPAAAQRRPAEPGSASTS